MKQCMHKIETVKVPKGNAFGLLLPFKTARWEDAELVPDNIDIRYLEDVVITIDDQPWEDYEMDERGPIVHIGADDFDLGAHNATIEATYAGVAIRGAFYECFTIVEWSFESNVEQHLPDSPLIAETSYVYIGITDDAELEALKQQYREATAACETARLAYEAAKEEFDEKAEQLNDVAQETTLTEGIQFVLQGLAPKATAQQLTDATASILTAISHIDIDTTTLAKEQTLTNALQSVLTALNPKATTNDVTTAKDAILEALSHISPEDPYSQALAQFFGLPQAMPEYTYATDQEVIDIVDDVYNDYFPTTAQTTAQATEQTTEQATEQNNND